MRACRTAISFLMSTTAKLQGMTMKQAALARFRGAHAGYVSALNAGEGIVPASLAVHASLGAIEPKSRRERCARMVRRALKARGRAVA